MSPAITFALLLISTAAAKSAHDGDEEGFLPQLEGDANKKVEHCSEEQILQDEAFPGSCLICKKVVSYTKKKLGNDHTKEKIKQLLYKTCNILKLGPLKSVCRKLVTKYGQKLIDAIASGDSLQAVCAKLRLCKRNLH